MKKAVIASLVALAASHLFADKLYLLKISPEAANELSTQQILELINSENAYDPQYNRDILGDVVKKVRIDDIDEVRAPKRKKIYYGKYYVEDVASGEIHSFGGNSNSISRMGNVVHNAGNAKRVDAIRAIISHLKEAKKLALRIQSPHFDKEYLRRDIESILRGLNAYVGDERK